MKTQWVAYSVFSVKYLSSVLLYTNYYLGIRNLNWGEDSKYLNIFQIIDRGIDIKKTRETHWRINYLGAEVWNCFILLNLKIKWIFLSSEPGFILSGFPDIFSLVIYTWKRVFSICFWRCISSGQIINMFPEFHTYLSIKWSSYLNHL